jgi:4-hydroxy-2-oxoheptanedioate aldolase
VTSVGSAAEGSRPGHGLRQRIERGELAVGASCRLGSAAVVEMVASAGFDYIYVDQQHGYVGSSELPSILSAAGRTDTTMIVRVPKNDATLIGFALDVGADGVLVPSVGSAEEAAMAVAACRYAPAGVRSFGQLRGRLNEVGPASRNAEVLCFPLVEDVRGLSAIEEIVKVDGVGGIWIGPADLALSMGIEPTANIIPGEHEDAITRIVAACGAVGIPAAISGDPGALGSRGFTMVTAGTDDGFVRSGMKAALTAAGR